MHSLFHKAIVKITDLAIFLIRTPILLTVIPIIHIAVDKNFDQLSIKER